MAFELDTTQGRNAIRPMIYTGFTKAVSTANNRIGENNLIQSTVAKLTTHLLGNGYECNYTK